MDGILIINKHKGCTSHDIVHKIKKITKEKVGHTGTLDPMATGVLPLLIGKGTLCSKYLIEHDKTYKATLKLGIETDTKDLEGRVIQEQAVDIKILEKSNVENILKSFVGKQEQIPPIYSAIKVDGKKLYEYAREGKEVIIQPRTIEIYDMNLEKIDRDNKEIVFLYDCGYCKKNAPHKEIENKIRFLYICGYFEKKTVPVYWEARRLRASSGTPKKIFYSVNIKQWLAGIKIKARDKKNFSDSHFVRARKFSVSIKFCLAV